MTQHAYCLDDETSWFDWSLLSKRADLLRFVALLNAERSMRVEHEQQRWTLNEILQRSDIGWHGVRLYEPDWRPSSHSIAFIARPPNEEMLFHVMLNAYWEPLSFELPPLDGGAHPWRRRIDTFLDSPHDIVEWEQAPEVRGTSYRVEPRSGVFCSRMPRREPPERRWVPARALQRSSRRERPRGTDAA